MGIRFFLQAVSIISYTSGFSKSSISQQGLCRRLPGLGNLNNEHGLVKALRQALPLSVSILKSGRTPSLRLVIHDEALALNAKKRGDFYDKNPAYLRLVVWLQGSHWRNPVKRTWFNSCFSLNAKKLGSSKKLIALLESVLLCLDLGDICDRTGQLLASATNAHTWTSLRVESVRLKKFIIAAELSEISDPGSIGYTGLHRRDHCLICVDIVMIPGPCEASFANPWPLLRKEGEEFLPFSNIVKPKSDNSSSSILSSKLVRLRVNPSQYSILLTLLLDAIVVTATLL